MEEGLTVMDWSSRSPNISRMEEIWGILVQFHRLDDLLEAIVEAWLGINGERVLPVLSSIIDRCAKVLDKRGGLGDQMQL